MYTVQCRVIVDSKCEFQHHRTVKITFVFHQRNQCMPFFELRYTQKKTTIPPPTLHLPRLSGEGPLDSFHHIARRRMHEISRGDVLISDRTKHATFQVHTTDKKSGVCLVSIFTVSSGTRESHDTVVALCLTNKYEKTQHWRDDSVISSSSGPDFLSRTSSLPARPACPSG